MKSKCTVKLLLFLLLGAGLAFGLLTAGNPNSSISDIDQPPADPNITLSGALCSQEKMLSDISQDKQKMWTDRVYYQRNERNQRRYVPNEIIVKYKERAIQRIVEKTGSSTQVKIQAIPSSLQILNQKYKVRDIRPLIPNFKQKTLKKDNSSQQMSEDIIAQQKIRWSSDSNAPAIDRIFKLTLEPQQGLSLADIVTAYNNSDEVEYAELNYIVSTTETIPDDPLFERQWSLNNAGQEYLPGFTGSVDSDIDAPEAWDIETDAGDVIVAVIDTGVDYTHRDLDDNMWRDPNGYFGYDFVNDDNDPNDDNGHGTHCAGVIGAEGDNGLDITGVCWDVKIMALKFLDSTGWGSTDDAIEAIYYAVANGADILSNSWGGEEYSLALKEAIDYAYSQGVIIVASAGNDGTESQLYPAAYDHVLSVAATDPDDRKARFSTYGPWVDIAAPGVDILSLRAGGTFSEVTFDDYTTVMSGTSMACPHVAGVCALLVSINPFLTSDEIYNVLMDSVDLIEDGYRISASGGRLNTAHALHEATPSKGRISLDKESYPCSGEIAIRLTDLDIAGYINCDVTITTSTGDIETVTLDEIVGNIGVFSGLIQTEFNEQTPEDGLLQIEHGDIITVIYQDSDDGSGKLAEAIDIAVADCMGPQISNVLIEGAGSIVTVSFETDEMSTAIVSAAFACHGNNSIMVNSPVLTTQHTVTLTNVEPQTDYFFVVETTDSIGNKTIDDNAGVCYTFTTSSVLGDIYVPDDFSDIQSAINRAWGGDTIWIADGIYTGQGNYDIDFLGKAITVRSENGPDNCIIDCGMKGRGFNFHTNETSDSVLNGFTIKNGYPAADVSPTINFDVWVGGGIYCKNSFPIITNCNIIDCFAPYWGGGVYINNFASTDWIQIENCVIARNIAKYWGGGISCGGNISLRNIRCTENVAGTGGGGIDTAGWLILDDCTIAGNSANSTYAASGYGGGINTSGGLEMINSVVRDNKSRYGGGVFSFGDLSSYINCIFDKNTASYGGGLSYYNGEVLLTNCTVVNNIAEYYGGAISYYQSVSENETIIENCILWNNNAGIGGNEISFPASDSELTVSYSDIKGGHTEIITAASTILNWDESNIQIDPNFAFADDYHLTKGSACIDSGTNNPSGDLAQIDIESNPRVMDQIVDMGAYEFDNTLPTIAVSPCGFEFNGYESSSDPLEQTLYVRNSANGLLSWQIEGDSPWLQVNSSSGISEGETDSVILSVQTNDLTAGNYECRLAVSDFNSNNSRIQIPLKLHVSGNLHVPINYPTIQSAINSAGHRDTVLVADGIYQGNGNRDIQLFGKAITVKSQNGPNNCVINCQGSGTSPHRGFVISNDKEEPNLIIEGFTITGGYVTSDYYAIFPPSQGGGIYCGIGNTTIQNCIIEGNSCWRGGFFPALGGGVMLEGDSLDKVFIRECKIQDNHVDTSGGGLFAVMPFLMENSILTQNDSTVSGGGLHVILYDQSSEIINCTIAENASTFGGGLCIDGGVEGDGAQSVLLMSNSIISANTAPNGSQIAMTAFYSDLFSRAGISYSNVEAVQNAIYQQDSFVLDWGVGNIFDDPLFVDPIEDDYRLLSTSPLIDKGSNQLIKHLTQVDLDDNPRFLDADYDGLPEVDMGAYEFIPPVFSGGPLIEISEWLFDFVAYQGEENPPSQTFGLRNSGTGLLQWQVPPSCPWLTVSPQQGTASAEFMEVTLQPETAGLTRGLYNCELAVEEPTAANHPRTFAVKLRVFERGKLYVPSEFSTIQKAVNAAVDGDRIIIASGTYPENIYIPGKNITLCSQDPNDPNIVANTIISGDGTGSVITFAGSEQTAKLLGLTITDGSADFGGGIQGNNAHTAIQKCVVRNNTASDYGGGIHAVQGPIRSCRIENNTAEFGGGLSDCNDVINCLVVSNQAFEGGGLYSANGDIIHCTVADNTADKGAGLSRCAGPIQNSIIWANSPDSLYQCSLPDYSCVQGGSRGVNSLDSDPQFVDPVGGNYRLIPGSLCIDAASPDTGLQIDIDNRTRPLDGDNNGSVLPDMGAYEMPLSNEPVIGITQDEFIFTNFSSESQTFNIWNASLPAVNYTISEPNCSWLNVIPTNGTVLDNPDTITLSVDISDIPAGAYECDLVISDPAAINDPRRIKVSLKILQDTIYVSPQRPTIQHALSYVTDGGTIILSDGVYAGPGNRDIDFQGRPATVTSANGPDNCIIDLGADPNHPHRGFLFQNGESSDSVIKGLTIINGYSTQSGGAVFCDRSSPSIVDCIFRNNHSDEDGGAVYAFYGNPVISGCEFLSNVADRGGATAIVQGDVSLTASSWIENTANQGGAVYIDNTFIHVVRCVFTQNAAYDGGAFFNNHVRGELTDCIFTENAAIYANWYHGGGAVLNQESPLTIQGCQFIGNQSAWDGGAIENWQSSPMISQCEFADNHALGNDGGAVFNIFNSDPNIARCTFLNNTAKSWGGAMRNRQSSPTITNSLFVGNDAADNGGAVFNFFRSSPVIVNCTFARNTANGHDGGAMYSLNDCIPTVVNSIFWENQTPQIFDSGAATSIEYSNISWPGAGNWDLPPEFQDPNSGDFRLSRISPCIDSGIGVSLNMDLDGNTQPWDCPWIPDSGIDRGAFEFTPVSASLKITPQAINCKSRGRDPRAKLVFDSDIKPEDIDQPVPVMIMTEKTAFEISNIEYLLKKSGLVLSFTFAREAFCGVGFDSGTIPVSVTGLLKDGRTFYGTNTIRLKIQ